MDLNSVQITIDSSGAVQALQNLTSAAASTGSTLNSTGTQIVNFYNTVNNSADKANDAASKTSSFIKVLSGVVSFFGSATLAVQGFIGAVTSIGNFFAGFVTAGAQVEVFRVQFGGLLGDYAAADVALNKLRTYANSSPFTFPQIAEATRSLYSVTSGLQAVGGNMDSVIKLMQSIGDSTPDPQRLGEVADSMGRLYATLHGGTGFEEPLRSLSSIGVLSSGLNITIQQMTTNGASFAEIWAKVMDDMSKTSGNSARMATTFTGLMSTLSDAYGTMQAKFGAPLVEALKQPIVDLTTWLTGEAGPAAEFGTAFGNQIRIIYGAAKNGELGTYLAAEFQKAMDALKGYWTTFATWASGIWTQYVLTPIQSGDFGTSILKTFLTIGQLLQAAFDDAISSFRAGMSAAIGQMEVMLDKVFTQLMSHVPSALGGGNTYSPSAESEKTYAEYKQTYSQGNTPYPNLSSITQPIIDAAGKVVAGFNAVSAASDTVNKSVNNLEGVFQVGKGSEVFGRNMDGSPDMTDAAMGANAHLGAYNNTNLLDPNLMGAAVSPQQASALTGISDNTKAMADILGRYLDITLNGQTSKVQVVDIAPNSNAGLEMTPAAHRAVGDNAGDASIGYRMSGANTDDIAQRALASTTVPQAPAGAGLVQPITAATQAYQDALRTLTQYSETLQQTGQAQTEYNKTAGALGVLLSQDKISQDAYNTALQAAQDKLIASNATYKEVAASINQAAAAMAAYKKYAAMETQRNALGVSGAGESMAFGAQQWSNQQGNASQQYTKLAGDGLTSFSNDASTAFTSFINGSKSAGDAFKSFATSILSDISTMITKMLILKAVQTLIGMASGTSGGWYTASAASGGGGTTSAGVMHSGGIVGGATSMRKVDSALFLNAGRYHTGLAGDEFPAILQNGETVVPKGMSVQPNQGATNVQQSTTVTQHITINSDGTAKDNGTSANGDQKQTATRAAKLFKQKAQEAVYDMQRQRFGVGGVGN